MNEEMDKEARLKKLQGQLYLAKCERDAWKGKPTEHYKLACLLVDSINEEISMLLASDGK